EIDYHGLLGVQHAGLKIAVVDLDGGHAKILSGSLSRYMWWQAQLNSSQFVSRTVESCKGGVHRLVRQFDQQRRFRKQQRGRYLAARIERLEQRAIERKLKDIGPGNLCKRSGRRAVGLVIDDQHLVGRDRQPVDLAGNGALFAPDIDASHE